jgi:hypothetical protein
VSTTHENPKDGEIIVQDSRAETHDLLRDYEWKAKLDNTEPTVVMRPGIDPDQHVRHKRMIADNYRVAAYQEKRPVTDLKAVNRYNIVTESTLEVFKRHIRDAPRKDVDITVGPGHVLFEDITRNTVHGAQIDKIFKEEPDFQDLHITQYTVYRRANRIGSGRNVRYTHTWHMKIHSAKKSESNQ